MRLARTRISLAELEMEDFRLKKAVTGAFIWEIHGKENGAKVDKFRRCWRLSSAKFLPQETMLKYLDCRV